MNLDCFYRLVRRVVVLPIGLSIVAGVCSGQTNVFPSSGNVGIGTVQPDAPLQVEGGAVINGALFVQSVGVAGAVGVDDWVHLKHNVLIGESSGLYPGHGGYRVNIVGNVKVYGNLYQSSDKSLKEGITPIANAIETVMSIEPVAFRWKDGADTSVHFGVIANDIEQVLPDIVNGEDGSKAVAYTELIPVLLQAIKEQQKQIEGLKAELAKSGPAE